MKRSLSPIRLKNPNEREVARLITAALVKEIARQKVQDGEWITFKWTKATGCWTFYGPTKTTIPNPAVVADFFKKTHMNTVELQIDSTGEAEAGGVYSANAHALDVTISTSLAPSNRETIYNEMLRFLSHELTHATQSVGRAGGTSASGYSTEGETYYLDPDEIQAYVRDIVTDARQRKVPFTTALHDFTKHIVAKGHVQTTNTIESAYLAYWRKMYDTRTTNPATVHNSRVQTSRGVIMAGRPLRRARMARSNPATRHRRSGNKWQLLQPGVWVLQQPEADGGTIGVLRDGKHYIAVRANGARFRGLRSLAGAKAVAGGASGEGLVDRQYLAALNEAKINPARHRGGLLSHSSIIIGTEIS